MSDDETRSVNGRSVRMLVADDDEGIRYLMHAMFARDPEIAIVAVAANGQEAVDQATAHAPDLVLLDVEMPGMDGISAIGPILTASPASKIVMFSAWDLRRDDALQAGAHAWITKGAQWPGLRTVLRDVLGDC
jgi:CheY-like chemotaxis protein